MALPDDLAVRIQHHKCFGVEAQGFATIKPMNLIIGRNNTGKSALLDLLGFVTGEQSLEDGIRNGGERPKAVLSATVSEAALKRAFPESHSGGQIGGNYWRFARPWVGSRLTWSVGPARRSDFVAIDPPFPDIELREQQQNLAAGMEDPFKGLRFRRLLADRDVVPEPDFSVGSIAANGAGLTNTIQSFVNKASLPSELVERTLLSEVNKIFEPDAKFTDIVVQQLADGRWEIYLEEEKKGRVPLSYSGSGVKTILLVLGYLYLIPVLDKQPLRSYLFGFEELENNLHPALQRRLLLYLREKAEVDGARFFLTTHSNVAIDLFANDPLAQTIHVTHNGQVGLARAVRTYVDNCGVLDDLDVRASDLLQSNGVIWVEGPSDRLYINRWIQLWTGGSLREGAHYQCVFYGGRLLSHLSAEDPTVDTGEVIRVLGVNRHAALLIDSDKSRADDKIGQTKQRLADEVERIRGFVWTTAGREVENYLPVEALRALSRRDDIKPLRRYDDIGKYLDRIRTGDGKRFERNKVIFAERIAPFLTKDQLTGMLDWTSRISALCSTIRRWNRMPEEAA